MTPVVRHFSPMRRPSQQGVHRGGDQQDPLSVLRGTHEKVRVVSDSNESLKTFVEELSPS